MISSYDRELGALEKSRSRQQTYLSAQTRDYEQRTQNVKGIYEDMDTSTWFTSHTPTTCSMDKAVGWALGANHHMVKRYRKALEAQRAAQRQLEEAQRSLSTVDTQVELTETIGRLQGELTGVQESNAAAARILETHQQDLNSRWGALSGSERVVYYIPTGLLRHAAGSCMGSRMGKVERCVDANNAFQTVREQLHQTNDTVTKIYQKIYETIAQKILVAPGSQPERCLARDCMHAYALALKLRAACQNAWSKILNYQWKDEQADVAEIAAIGADSDSDRRKDADSVRTDADWAKWSAQSQIEYVQKLARQLDAQTRILQQQTDHKLITTDLSNVLGDANLSLTLYDWTDRLAGDSFFRNLTHIAELLNHFDIQGQLEQIEQHAEEIGQRLENALVPLFVTQRYAHLKAEQAIAENEGSHIRTFLQGWAKPSVFEYIL